ncbi:MAG: hypothetical protein GVY10_00495 [Verrucomicrobia bacterium]|nr:hypothetical protein [Verrucomicrobiota bacterium]
MRCFVKRRKEPIALTSLHRSECVAAFRRKALLAKRLRLGMRVVDPT